MTHGSYANVERAGFVRTPPTIAQYCRHLVTLPDHDLFSVGDLTCGKGDFLLPFVQLNAHMIGTELSRDRAAIATELLPEAAIYATAIEHKRCSLSCASSPRTSPMTRQDWLVA
jgi:predicted RNA methylase